MMTRILGFTFGLVLLLFPQSRYMAEGAALQQQPLEPLTKFRNFPSKV
jgi:hypothetical protein